MNGSATVTFDRAFYARELLISLVINEILTLVATWVVFHGRRDIPFWGATGIAFDAIPMTFMIATMTTIGAGFGLNRYCRGLPAAPGRSFVTRLLRPLLPRGIIVGAAATLILVPLAVGLMTVILSDQTSFQTLVVAKLIHGAVLALAVTPVSLKIGRAQFQA